MARELALPSPPFDLGRALEQGVSRFWIVENLMWGGNLVRWGDYGCRLPPAVVLLLQPLVEDGDEERVVALVAVLPLRRKCSGPAAS